MPENLTFSRGNALILQNPEGTWTDEIKTYFFFFLSVEVSIEGCHKYLSMRMQNGEFIS